MAMTDRARTSNAAVHCAPICRAFRATALAPSAVAGPTDGIVLSCVLAETLYRNRYSGL